MTTIINPILHMRKLRLREMKSLAQDTHLLSCGAEMLTHPVWPGDTALKPGTQHLWRRDWLDLLLSLRLQKLSQVPVV